MHPLHAKFPCSERLVDVNTIRVTALLVSAAMAIEVWLPTGWVALALCADSAIRGFTRLRSPLGRAAQVATELLGTTPRPDDAGPRTFAARTWAAMSLGVTAAALLGAPNTAATLAGVLTLSAALDAFFGVCVGCLVCNALMRLGSLKSLLEPSWPPASH